MQPRSRYGALATLALIALTAARALHWMQHRGRTVARGAKPMITQFWGRAREGP
jgi:hypothetical protein